MQAAASCRGEINPRHPVEGAAAPRERDLSPVKREENKTTRRVDRHPPKFLQSRGSCEKKNLVKAGGAEDIAASGYENQLHASPEKGGLVEEGRRERRAISP